MSTHKIVLSGGPGAGKSTSLQPLKEIFEKKGYRVIPVSETATELINAGISPWTSPDYEEFQSILMDLQLDKEKAAGRFAAMHPDEEVILLFDRGALDNKAFMKPEQFAHMLEKMGLNEKDLYDRYDAIFHLESPARIYPEIYTLENNPARKHSAAQSIELDRDLAEIWKKHPNYVLIEANRDFDQKIAKTAQAIENFLSKSKNTEKQSGME